jgi:hypothetical protein
LARLGGDADRLELRPGDLELDLELHPFIE